VPVDALDVMRVRAAAEGTSLEACLRRRVYPRVADIVAATRAGRGE